MLALGFAYLLGSIPSSVWAGKWFYGIDVREHGSGNAGATNTYRVLGAKVAIPVFLIDALKGFLAVRAIFLFSGLYPDVSFTIYHLFALGMAAVLGHIFPILAGFKGGKGVATLCGVVLALHPMATLLVFLIFVIVLLTTGYVSVGSMVAGVSYPPLLMIAFPDAPPPLLYFSIVLAILLVFTHRKNIQRLATGTENRFYFRKR